MEDKKVQLTTDNIKYLLANLKQLTFEVTDACNLRCKYCGYGEFYDDYDKRENKMISVKAAINLIDYLINYWKSNLNISSNRNVFISFYGGEPLLNFKFIQTIVSRLENLDCPYRNFSFSMTTNAILLDRYMDYLAEKQFHLLISLDGNEYNTSYRVDKADKPAFQRIIKNVDTLQKKYPAYFEQKVNFNAVLHNRNSVESIVQFIKDKYNKIPSIGELNNIGIKPNKEKVFKDTYQNIRESLYQSENYEAIEQEMFLSSTNYLNLSRFLYQYSGFVYKDYTDLLFDNSNKKRFPTGTCLPFDKKMFITVNGKILPCERISHKYALGSVSDQEVILDFQSIVDKYNGYYAKLDNQCSICHNAKTCIQCVFNLNDLAETKPVCFGFMNKQKFQDYVETQMDFLREHPEDYYRIMEEVIVE
jgi:uncharacterized protein